ncbi:MAG: histidine phosphatase family protein [Coriobacteriia bacterium]
MAEKRLLIVRHAETSANREGRYLGRGEAAFTERGEAQVLLIAERIHDFAPDRLVTSPLQRTRVIAEHAGRLVGLEPELEPRLTELDFGEAEGMTYDEAQRAGLKFEFKAWDAPVAPGGESRRQVFERTAAVLDELMFSSARHIAIVTHGGVFRSALPHLLGLPSDAIWIFDIRNGSAAECRIFDGHARLVEFVTIG